MKQTKEKKETRKREKRELATANGNEKKEKRREKRAGYLLLFDWSESSGTCPACALYYERKKEKKEEKEEEEEENLSLIQKNIRKKRGYGTALSESNSKLRNKLFPST